MEEEDERMRCEKMKILTFSAEERMEEGMIRWRS